jgi:hypothetical protein
MHQKFVQKTKCVRPTGNKLFFAFSLFLYTVPYQIFYGVSHISWSVNTCEIPGEISIRLPSIQRTFSDTVLQNKGKRQGCLINSWIRKYLTKNTVQSIKH